MATFAPLRCPSCGEQQNWRMVDTSNQGFSLGKAAVGGILLGPLGLLGGALGKKKTTYYCASCGFSCAYDKSKQAFNLETDTRNYGAPVQGTVHQVNAPSNANPVQKVLPPGTPPVKYDLTANMDRLAARNPQELANYRNYCKELYNYNKAHFEFLESQLGENSKSKGLNTAITAFSTSHALYIAVEHGKSAPLVLNAYNEIFNSNLDVAKLEKAYNLKLQTDKLFVTNFDHPKCVDPTYKYFATKLYNLTLEQPQFDKEFADSSIDMAHFLAFNIGWCLTFHCEEPAPAMRALMEWDEVITAFIKSVK